MRLIAIRRSIIATAPTAVTKAAQTVGSLAFIVLKVPMLKDAQTGAQKQSALEREQTRQQTGESPRHEAIFTAVQPHLHATADLH